MIYMICPTCKRWLADKQEQYNKIMDQICKDVESGKFDLEKGEELKKKFMTSLGLTRYCCIQRIMTYKKLIEIVK